MSTSTTPAAPAVEFPTADEQEPGKLVATFDVRNTTPGGMPVLQHINPANGVAYEKADSLSDRWYINKQAGKALAGGSGLFRVTIEAL